MQKILVIDDEDQYSEIIATTQKLIGYEMDVFVSELRKYLNDDPSVSISPSMEKG